MTTTMSEWLVLLEIVRSVILLVVLAFLIKLMFQASYDRRQRELEMNDLKQSAKALSERTDELIQQNTNITQVAADASAAAVEAANHVNEKIAEIATGIKLDNAQKEQDLQRRIEDDARRTKDDERRVKDDKRRDS